MILCFRFQLAYLDFFEDEWVKNGYDWKKVAIDYMMKEPRPLLHGAACGRKFLFLFSRKKGERH